MLAALSFFLVPSLCMSQLSLSLGAVNLRGTIPAVTRKAGEAASPCSPFPVQENSFELGNSPSVLSSSSLGNGIVQAK